MNRNLLQCPWDGFVRGSTTFCEQTLCSWVESPGIAWAGFVYIAIGIYLYKMTKAENQDHWVLKSFPFFAVIMGLGSLLYHSSHAFIFQAWDVGAMFLLGTGLCFFNFTELVTSLRIQNQKILFWGLIVIEIGLFVWLKSKSGPIILGVLIFIFIVTEFQIRFKPNAIPRNRNFLWISLLLFAIGCAALWMEHRSGLCNPDNHFFQWHAVWDSACAITYLTLYRYLSSSKMSTLTDD
jgi:hypothetical protein